MSGVTKTVEILTMLYFILGITGLLVIHIFYVASVRRLQETPMLLPGPQNLMALLKPPKTEINKSCT